MEGAIKTKQQPRTTAIIAVDVHTENVEHCGGEPEQAANMHMNRLNFMLK